MGRKKYLMLCWLMTATAFAAPNSLVVFSPNRDMGQGQHGVYSTLNNTQRYLTTLNLTDGTLILGLGAQFGTDADPLGQAGEVFIYSKTGSPLAGAVSQPGTGHANVMDPEAHIGFSQIAILDPDTAVSKSYDDPIQMGTVMWNFYRDESTITIPFTNFGIGLHNTFTGSDNGYTKDLFAVTQVAQANSTAPDKWATPDARNLLSQKNMAFADDPTWGQFSKTNAQGLMFSDWMAFIRSKGWNAAAVVVEGSVLAADYFRMIKVNNKNFFTLPPTPALSFEFDSDGLSHDWIMGGVIFDKENPSIANKVTDINYALDSLGNGFHIHGMRVDRQKVGHILFAMLSNSSLKVTFYPLDLSKDFQVFRNDLLVETGSATFGANFLDVKVQNKGENLVRDISVIASGHSPCQPVTVHLDFMAANEERVVHFENVEKGSCFERVTIQSNQKIIEGGAGTVNNTLNL
jgi:hypothetical protein